MAGVGEHFFGPGKHDGGKSGEEHGGHIRMAFIGASEEDLVEAAARIGVACEEVAIEMGISASAEVVVSNAAEVTKARM